MASCVPSYHNQIQVLHVYRFLEDYLRQTIEWWEASRVGWRSPESCPKPGPCTSPRKKQLESEREGGTWTGVVLQHVVKVFRVFKSH